MCLVEMRTPFVFSPTEMSLPGVPTAMARLAVGSHLRGFCVTLPLPSLCNFDLMGSLAIKRIGKIAFLLRRFAPETDIRWRWIRLEAVGRGVAEPLRALDGETVWLWEFGLTESIQYFRRM